MSNSFQKNKMKPAKLLEAFSNWSKSNFPENWGQKGLTLETKQIINDDWINKSIPSVDCRNGHECMKIKKNIYMQKCNKLENETLLIEKMNKRGILQYNATMHWVATCTLQTLQFKMASKWYRKVHWMSFCFKTLLCNPYYREGKTFMFV